MTSSWNKRTGMLSQLGSWLLMAWRSHQFLLGTIRFQHRNVYKELPNSYACHTFLHHRLLTFIIRLSAWNSVHLQCNQSYSEGFMRHKERCIFQSSWLCIWNQLLVSNGWLFQYQIDLLSQDLVMSQRREIGVRGFPTALKFGRLLLPSRLSKMKRGLTILTSNLGNLRIGVSVFTSVNQS